MSITATALSLAGAADPPVARSVAALDSCDFYGDGRLGVAGGQVPSAWTCPAFYLAIPTCAVLFLAVAIIRLCRLVSSAGGRSRS